jgi:hypothetical protein
MRLIADWLIPVAAAIERVDQRASFDGLLERLDDQPLDVRIVDRPRFARSRLIVKAVDASTDEPTAPLTHRVGITTQAGGDVLALLTGSCLPPLHVAGRLTRHARRLTLHVLAD